MKSQKRRCHCLHCKQLFVPDPRNQGRQRFCGKPECQKTRKGASQKAWLQKSENQDYFRDAQNAQRVRTWQKAHPGYWKNTSRWRKRTLQEAFSEEPVVHETVQAASPTRTLQDLCSMQTPLLVGLISMWSGSTLQEDIALSTRQLVAKGHDILGMMPGMNLERSLHEKTGSLSATAPQNSCPVQLDRSPAGAGKLFHPV